MLAAMSVASTYSRWADPAGGHQRLIARSSGDVKHPTATNHVAELEHPLCRRPESLRASRRAPIPRLGDITRAPCPTFLAFAASHRGTLRPPQDLPNP